MYLGKIVVGSKRIIVLVLFLFLFLFFVASVSATDIPVSGSSFDNITSTIASANDGDSILLDNKTYNS